MSYVLNFVHQVAGRPTIRSATDAELLKRFARVRDADAFAGLVARHSPMVLHLCRRMLGDAQAAEDACQAVFLILARRAGAIARPDALTGWLYRVAYRTARKARATLVRRRLREADYPTTGLSDTHVDPLAELSARELLNIVEDEIQKLPDAYRLAVVLCCLEGLSREEAARQLRCSAGTIKGRLERGRARLQARLARRGMTLTAAFAAIETSRTAAHALSAPDQRAVVKAALQFAVGSDAGFINELLLGARNASFAVVREFTFCRNAGRILLCGLLVMASGVVVTSYYSGSDDRGTKIAQSDAIPTEPPTLSFGGHSDLVAEPSLSPSPDRATADSPGSLLHKRVAEEAQAIGSAIIKVRQEVNGDTTRTEIVVEENSKVERYSTPAEVPASYQEAVNSLLDRLRRPALGPGVPPGK